MMTRFGFALLWLLHFLPLPVLAGFGNGLGFLLYILAAERRMVAHTNLRLCFPEMSQRERTRLVRRNFMAFGRSLVERSILWWASGERIKSLVQIKGLEHYQAVEKGPVILLAPHFVALDVGGSWLSQYGDMFSVYSNQKNPVFHAKLLEGRSRFGNQLLISRQQGLRPVVKALRKGLSFYYLPDQDLSIKDALFIPFFGVPAATLNTVSRLVEMTGARVVPIVTRMLPHGQGYELQFYPAWENYPTGDDVADTRRMNEFIEQRVLEIPEQYFWLHKRFKTRPEGEKRFY
ncbi:MAG: lipid A biosynthesis acyltransferase [Gallionellaceae bacterium]|nr:lipid A biosynthesis acyltransferase [Gallionellaceae bacterium]